MQKQVVKGPPAAEGRHPNVAAPPAHLDHPWCRRNVGIALLEAPARCKPAVSPPSSAPQSPSTMAGYQPGDKATQYLLGTARTTLPGLLRFRFLLTCTCTNLRSHKSTNRIYSSAQTPMAGGTPHIALMTVSHTEHLVLSAAPCTGGRSAPSWHQPTAALSSGHTLFFTNFCSFSPKLANRQDAWF